MCRHPKLTEIDNITGVNVDIEGQRGNVTGMFLYKKYYCKKCKCLITILNAIVEKPKEKK